MDKNIALVGFMGSGKTAVSRALSEKLKRKFVSTDEMIVQKEKCPIAEIFSGKGEKHFREVERKVIAEVSQEKGLVIDCGGGVVLKKENILDLKKNGVIVYLKASVDVLHERTKDQRHRPLLNVSDPQTTIKELLLSRESFYNKADYVIDTSAKSVDEISEEIIRLVSHD